MLAISGLAYNQLLACAAPEQAVVLATALVQLLPQADAHLHAELTGVAQQARVLLLASQRLLDVHSQKPDRWAAASWFAAHAAWAPDQRGACLYSMLRSQARHLLVQTAINTRVTFTCSLTTVPSPPCIPACSTQPLVLASSLQGRLAQHMQALPAEQHPQLHLLQHCLALETAVRQGDGAAVLHALGRLQPLAGHLAAPQRAAVLASLGEQSSGMVREATCALMLDSLEAEGQQGAASLEAVSIVPALLSQLALPPALQLRALLLAQRQLSGVPRESQCPVWAACCRWLAAHAWNAGATLAQGGDGSGLAGEFLSAAVLLQETCAPAGAQQLRRMRAALAAKDAAPSGGGTAADVPSSTAQHAGAGQPVAVESQQDSPMQQESLAIPEAAASPAALGMAADSPASAAAAALPAASSGVRGSAVQPTEHTSPAGQEMQPQSVPASPASSPAPPPTEQPPALLQAPPPTLPALLAVLPPAPASSDAQPVPARAPPSPAVAHKPDSAPAPGPPSLAAPAARKPQLAPAPAPFSLAAAAAAAAAEAEEDAASEGSAGEEEEGGGSWLDAVFAAQQRARATGGPPTRHAAAAGRAGASGVAGGISVDGAAAFAAPSLRAQQAAVPKQAVVAAAEEDDADALSLAGSLPGLGFGCL